MRSNSEHKVLAAWLNTLREPGDSLCAKPNGADQRDFRENPSVGFHVGNKAVMLNLEGIENSSVTNMLSTPLTTEIEDVDSVTEICSKCNSGYIPSLGSADTIEMVDAILQSLCLSCSSGVTQTENIVIEDLGIVGSSSLGKCGGPGHHNCKLTREPEKDSNDVSLCASSKKLVSDKVEALNPTQFLPHFLFSIKTGSNDTPSFKNSLPALKATSTEGNVKFVTSKTSLLKNPVQLLPHMIQLSNSMSSEQLSCSCVVEPLRDDRINYHCKEKRIESDELQSCAELNSIDTQLPPVMKPILSKSRRPKPHLKTEVVNSLEQPLRCEKLEEIVIPVNRNLSNPRSGCDRWSLQGVSSRLKASQRHLGSSYFCDKMWYKYSYIQHIHELDKAVGRRFISFAFPMED